MKRILFFISVVGMGFVIWFLFFREAKPLTKTYLQKDFGAYSLTVYEDNYHATVPFYYRYVLKHKSSNDEMYFLKTSKSDPQEVNITMADKRLMIECIKGNISVFTNRLYINGEFLRVELNTQCK